MSVKRDWYTPVEVGEMFGLQAQTVRWWILTGKLDGEQASNGRYLISALAVERFRAQRHAANTLPPARAGETSSRPTIRKPIDPAKRYRVKGTDEVITGAEVLRRRGEA